MKITLTTEYYSNPSHRVYKNKEALEKRAPNKTTKDSPINKISEDNKVSSVHLSISKKNKSKKHGTNLKKYLKLSKYRKNN
ncbi:MAG: hypothetical protein HOI53_07010 [Francisellaceae bacterium]|mgnify:FL=1|jgi:hypothetical protein|nr:hypothetical protein [Francisellaceae bacterium]MBT6207761.1 hypothetical protein [Francisellaceae bacterium]MBT6539774.1 hypothetical protein [Francisellaceae bacterium]